MARQRMAVLYDRSVTSGGLVVGTGNKTESLIGYTTLFGDSACAFNPIGDLYKSQVRQLAAAIGVPEQIIRKAPSADLWPGQTDEGEAGFSYPILDRLLFWRIDKRRSIEEVVALGFERGPRRARRADGRDLRVQAPGAADRQARAADGRASITSIPRRRPGSKRARRTRGAPGPARPGGDGGRALISRTPIGNLGDVTFRAVEVLRGGAPDRRRGHPDHPAPARPPRDRDAPRATTPGAGPAREAELLAHLRGGADLALVTDAGTPGVSDPGMELARGVGSGRRTGRADPRRLGRSRGRGRPRRRRAALGLRGVPPATRPRAPRAAGPDRRRRARDGHLRGAGRLRGDARATSPPPADRPTWARSAES